MSRNGLGSRKRAFVLALSILAFSADSSLASSLHEAAERGDLQQVRLLLSEGLSVNARDDRQRTSLHWAVQEGHEPVAKLLVAGGADVNARDKGGFTPLVEAVAHEDLGIAELLVQNGADVNAVAEQGTSVLHAAATVREAESVRFLLARGADVSARDADGETPLHRAVMTPQLNLLEEAREGFLTEELLLGAGADVNAASTDGTTPLGWAVMESNTKQAMFLIRNGANVNGRNHRTGIPLLHEAVFARDLAMVKVVVKGGADLEARHDGRTAYEVAKQLRLAPIAAFLGREMHQRPGRTGSPARDPSR